MLKLPEAVSVMSIVKLSPQAYLPSKATPDAVGFDVYALEDVDVPSWQCTKLRTGIRATPPAGHYLRVTGRSGLTSQGFFVLQGVVDPDYSGEIMIIVFNSNNFTMNVKKGNRIAQLVPEKFAANCTVVVLENSSLAVSDAMRLASGSRGTRGFGSSGL